MRSPRGFAASLALLLGTVLAIVCGAVFGDGAEDVLHLALAASFLLFAFAVFDFKLPTWLNAPACVAAGVLAAVFLLQGLGDIIQSAALRHIAYDVLGQRLEKMLGYVFLLWCVAMLLRESEGKTKLFGAIVLVAILCVEIYSFAVSRAGGEAPGVLKLFYLLLFVWLLCESVKSRVRRARSNGT